MALKQCRTRLWVLKKFEKSAIAEIVCQGASCQMLELRAPFCLGFEERALKGHFSQEFEIFARSTRKSV